MDLNKWYLEVQPIDYKVDDPFTQWLYWVVALTIHYCEGELE